MHRLTSGSFLQQHLSLLPDMSPVKSLRLLIRQVQQPLRAQLLVLIAHRVGNTQGRCPWALGIWEHVQLRHVQPVEKCVCLLKTLRRLTSTAHHHVDSDERIRHQRLNPVDLVSKQLRIVVPVHQLQHCVAATLQRDMEVRHKRAALGTIGNQLV